MNKKIILSLGTVALLTTSVFAANQKYINMNIVPKHKVLNKHQQKELKFLHLVDKLNLTKEQISQIEELIKEPILNMPHPSDAFTSTSFDKSKFISIGENKIKFRAKIAAEFIENVYVILTLQQKRDLKTIIEMQKIRKARRVIK